MNWLSRWDTENLYIAARAKHTENPSSCSWIFETLEYKVWISSAQSTSLWINSGPGTGKTILAGHIVHSIREQYDGSSSALAYLFCSSRDGLENDPIGPLRSILCQLLDALPSLPQPVVEEYMGQRRKGLELSYVLHPFWLQELLKQTLSLFKSVYLVVDGIDECEDREDLACLSVIGHGCEGSAIHVLATSRPESDISR
jgi:NACHT domain